MARKTKTIDERMSVIDEKIAKKQAEIAVLETQKHKMLHPLSMRDVMSKAKEAGMSAHDVAEKLGINID